MLPFEHPTITSEMIEEELYWKIVDDSFENSDCLDYQEQYLIDQIERLTPKEIIGFIAIFELII